ncbi:MAG TPA: hypothetical protein VHY22_06020 [Chthoniobacteraceae bacterium]|jgi:predicted exporter|nr:hypothetical protein [Chthoniobacteraceae bacterium]
MRQLKFLALTGLLAAAASTFLHPAHGQTATVGDIKAMADTIQALQDQQKTISDNQEKIDGKLADIAENIRVARIYAARVR